MTETKVMTELETLKQKCLKKDGSPRINAESADLVRLKVLQDADPLSKAELEEAKVREDKRIEQDRAAFKAKQEAQGRDVVAPDPAIDKPQPTEHPRITALKTALLPFTQLEVNETRSNDFILINRGIAITAGDVRAARKAMQI